jgi:hypothetical protein
MASVAAAMQILTATPAQRLLAGFGASALDACPHILSSTRICVAAARAPCHLGPVHIGRISEIQRRQSLGLCALLLKKIGSLTESRDIFFFFQLQRPMNLNEKYRFS